MPPPFWRRASKKDRWTQRLSGLTFSPSTLQHGVEQWIASLRDSPARTYPLPGVGQGLTASEAGCSSTSSTLPTLAVRSGLLWRTSQASLLPPPPLWTKPKGLSTSARPPASWENWPTAGGMRNGSLFQRPTWAPAMGGKGGFAGPGDNWTTPTATDHQKDRMGDEAMARELTRQNAGKALAKDARFWLTPNVPNGGRSVSAELVASKGTTVGGQKRTVDLGSQVTHWATPKANDSEKRGNVAHRPHMPELVGQAQAWPTPKGTDGTKGGPNQAGSKGDLMLPSAAAQWPTPAARDYRSESAGGGFVTDRLNQTRGQTLSFTVAHSLPQDQPMPDGHQSSSDGPILRRRLNPEFAGWLMGWPLMWTSAEPRDCGALETELWRSRLQQALCSCFGERE